MKIEYISSDGIQQAEKEALNKMREAFNSSPFSQSWHGFAGFEMIDRVHRDREIDLVLLTHDRVLLIELKNWRGVVTPMRDHWLKNGQDMGRSAVKTISAKLKIFASKMKRHLPDPVRASWNEYRVIFCGNESFQALPEDERAFIVRLDDFLKIATPGNYIKFFGNRRHDAINPTQYVGDFAKFIRGPEFKATNFSFNNFQIEGEPLFEHGGQLYKEYRSLKKDDSRVQALMRRWDFAALAGRADTVDERATIALREHRVLGYLQDVREELFNRFLQPLSHPTRDDVDADFCELYRLPPRLLRLSSFVNRFGTTIPSQERLSMVKALLSHFSDLHETGVAHRDVGEHTLWLERPSQVLVSGLLAASFPEVGTVGDLQQFIRAGSIRMPEETEDFGEGAISDPFRRDVYMLGVAVHQLLFLERPPLSEGVGIYYWISRDGDPFQGQLNQWLERALDPVPEDRFANAREMLEGLNSLTTRAATSAPDLDFGDFEIYRTEVLPLVAYPIEENLKQSKKHVYRSTIGDSQVCVKLWYGLAPDQRRIGLAHQLLSFLERVRQMKAQPCSSLPGIVDFGLSQAGLFIVTEWITGTQLDTHNTLSQRDALDLCMKLVDALDSAHALGFSHGDLSPEHVLITDGKIRFIDSMDFNPDISTQPFNLAYGPPDAASVTAQERDCYAGAKILSEILNHSGKGESDDKTLRDELQLCLEKDLGIYRLERVAGALKTLLSNGQSEEHLILIFDRITEPHLFPSDNGHYHIDLFSDRKSIDHIMLAITGIRTQLLIKLDKHTRTVTWSRELEIPHSQFVQQANRAVAKLAATIKVSPGKRTDFTSIASAALGIPSVSELFEDLAGVEAPADTRTGTEPLPSTKEIWKGLIEAEEATLPQVLIAGATKWDINLSGRLHIPYSKPGEPVDYGADDRINVLQERDGEAIRIGVLNTQETTPTVLVLDRVERSIKQTLGTPLWLQSTQDRASFQKRRSAAMRIADQKSVIPNLLDFFDPAISSASVLYDSAPTDGDLDVYDVLEDGNPVFSLNTQQRDAFRRLWSHGPVSLLQAPPGTGKTAFIASFIHYAFKRGAHQILLASQSHEAVNNAAEKVVELCDRTGTQMGIVRFGSEGMVSDPLKPYHVNSILSNYREQFRAEMKQRILSLSSNLGLPDAYVDEWWAIESQLGRVARELLHLENKIEQASDRSKLKKEEMEKTRTKRVDLFKRIASSQFSIPDVADSELVLSQLHTGLLAKYGISSPDAVRRLERIAQLSQEWIDRLATLRGNFEEFLAKTRNLVCGTCVGLGRTEFGITNSAYDWVIIDEAARATPGELAVALQTGRRVLLVGDHRQLPPLYTREATDHMASHFTGTERAVLMQSDFERAFESEFGREVGATLQTQYRMAPPIGSLVSECFYPTALIPGRGDAKEWLATLPVGANSVVTWIDTSAAQSQSFERRKANHGIDNPYEARVILSLLKSISVDEVMMNRLSTLSNGERECIGVICMYAEQKTLLQKMLSEQDWAVDIKELIKVDTVDSYQGKENPIIIVSLTRNNSRFEQGFLRAPERINVAASRAMERLIFVGASRMWSERNSISPLGKVFNFIQNKSDDKHYQICVADNILNGGASA